MESVPPKPAPPRKPLRREDGVVTGDQSGPTAWRNWFKLKSVPGIGNLLFKRLWDAFKSPQKVFEASDAELMQVPGMSERLVRTLKGHRTPAWIAEEIEHVLQNGFQVVTLADPGYPRLLREVPDPPPLLYVHGQLKAAEACISVVGSRNATRYGLSTARRICRDLVARHLTIVSGMARGIDTAAHEGALMGQGRTIAVLGSGLQRIYPAENRELVDRIAQNGAVISEFALQAEPDAHNFPQRNRIISGMALGTIIVEATPRSGSLITARLAAEQNREVFAIPGSIRSFKSAGSHGLIKQGAKLVEHAQDVLEELAGHLGPPAPPSSAPAQDRTDLYATLNEDETAVVSELEPYPVHIDNLTRKLQMEAGRVSSILIQLELKGIVQQHPGSLFALCLDRP